MSLTFAKCWPLTRNGGADIRVPPVKDVLVRHNGNGVRISGGSSCSGSVSTETNETYDGANLIRHIFRDLVRQYTKCVFRFPDQPNRVSFYIRLGAETRFPCRYTNSWFGCILPVLQRQTGLNCQLTVRTYSRFRYSTVSR